MKYKYRIVKRKQEYASGRTSEYYLVKWSKLGLFWNHIERTGIVRKHKTKKHAEEQIKEYRDNEVVNKETRCETYLDK